MSTTHVSWGSIELLHNAVRTLTHLNEQGQPFPTVEYRAKIKLHGTNCAVQITDAGPVAQSRNLILTPEADHKGFAKWAASRADYWSTVATGLVVFGEWCGPGVEKGMAISQAKTKLFCVFAIREGDRMIVEPSELEALLPARPDDVHVLPWEGEPVTIDFGSRADLERVAKHLNDRVAEVEAEDPWCKRVLGVTGLGEGLVFYPVLDKSGDRRVRSSAEGDAKLYKSGERRARSSAEGDAKLLIDQTLMFKAKGDKHRMTGKSAVQVDASVAASADEFVALVVTDARLRQGLEAIGGEFDAKKTGAFLSWIAADVQKESVAELEASSLTWAQVEKVVQQRARKWFLGGGL